MYHMTEWLYHHGHSDQSPVTEVNDEGVSCRDNQLPRLLTATVNILTKSLAIQQV